MNSPQFADGPPVPLMTEGTIDAATLRQLVADLLNHAVVMVVREKGGPGAYAAPEDQPLGVAIDRLLSGEARAVQVRYRYDGCEWTDTVMASPTGFRVLRCRHDEV